MKVSLLLKKIFNFQSFYGQSTFLEISSRMVLQKETQPPKQGRKDRKMEYIDQRNNVYRISSTVAYLLGVRKQIFENEYEPPMIEVFQNLEQDKDARIIRNLCRLRTAIEQNYTQILYEFRYNMKSLHTLP